MSDSKSQKNIDKIAALRKTELFAKISDPVVSEAASRSVVRRLKTGEILYSEHEEVSGLFIVAEGELRSIRQNARGREQVLSVEKPGAILSVAPVFNGRKYYSTAIANTDSYILCIETQNLHNLCREHPELLWSLTVVFAHRVRHYAELIETLALRNVDQRVAQYLLSLCGQQGKADGDSCRIEIAITQAEMASRIGSTREVVCRSLAHLEEDGLIQSHGPRVMQIPSMQALGNFAGVHHELEAPRVVSELSAEIA